MEPESISLRRIQDFICKICVFHHHLQPTLSTLVDSTKLFWPQRQLIQHSAVGMWRAIRLPSLIPNLSNIHMQSGLNICYNWSQRRGCLCSHMPEQSACRMFSFSLWSLSHSSILLFSSCSCLWVLLSSIFAPLLLPLLPEYPHHIIINIIITNNNTIIRTNITMIIIITVILTHITIIIIITAIITNIIFINITII